MKTRFGTRSLARAAGAIMLLGVALIAGGAAASTITLSDTSGHSLTCNLTSIDYGNVEAVTAVVADGCLGYGFSTLTVAKSGTGSGTVASDIGGISCGSGSDCSKPYNNGTTVVLTATPTDANSTFGGWGASPCTTKTSTAAGGTCTLMLSSNVTVTAAFNPVVAAGACPDQPAGTFVVQAGNLNASWARQTYYPTPQPIYAFEIKVPTGVSTRDDFKIAKTSLALKSKQVVISACPGSSVPVGAYCTVLGGAETTTVPMSTRSVDSTYYCKLTPGVTYYANAFSKNKDGTASCSTSSSPYGCGFSASRGAPY